jgi:hypothetical protein
VTRNSGRVVMAWAEHCAGPGWSNHLLWYIVRRNDEYVLECLQPDEQTAEMRTLFDVSAVVSSQMRALVSALPEEQNIVPIRPKTKKKRGAK